MTSPFKEKYFKVFTERALDPQEDREFQTLYKSRGRQLGVYIFLFALTTCGLQRKSMKRAKEISTRFRLVDVRLSQTSVRFVYIPLLNKRLM